MTVGELIERLQGFDPSLPALTRGFDEAGLDDIGTVREIHHRRNVNSGHSGDHDEATADEPNAVPAVLIDF